MSPAHLTDTLLPLRPGHGSTSKMVSASFSGARTLLMPCAEVDKKQLESPLPPIPPLCDHKSCGGCYVGYPQSRFPNWTERQVKKSRIFDAIHEYDHEKTCILHRVDVDSNGFFTNPGQITALPRHDAEIWEELIHEQVRVKD